MTDPAPPLRFRDSEACEAQPFLLWDTLWIQEPITHLTAQGGFGDWDIGNWDEPGNMGGLRAKATLHTATLLLLFTDKRAPVDAINREGEDPRGWWGDSVLFANEPIDRELGSHLWMLERGTLSDDTVLVAQEMCEQALFVLIEQGVVARTEVEVEAVTWKGQLLIGVRHFSHTDETIYDQRFEWIWGQTVRFPEAQRLQRVPGQVAASNVPMLMGGSAPLIDPEGDGIEVP